MNGRGLWRLNHFFLNISVQHLFQCCYIQNQNCRAFQELSISWSLVTIRQFLPFEIIFLHRQVIILLLMRSSLINAIEDRGPKSRTLFQHEPVGYWANPYWPVPHYSKLTFPNQPQETVRYPQVNINRFADQSAPKPPGDSLSNTFHR